MGQKIKSKSQRFNLGIRVQATFDSGSFVKEVDGKVTLVVQIKKNEIASDSCCITSQPLKIPQSIS